MAKLRAAPFARHEQISLPSSHGQSGGCRRPQVLRSARTCAALCSTAIYQYRVERRRGGRHRGLPVVRWRSSGLRPSLATADSLPSSRGQSGGCRRPQVLRSARTCAALRSTAKYQYRFGRRSGWSPQDAQARSVLRAARVRGGMTAAGCLLEANSVTARLSFGTPARAISGGSRRPPLRLALSWPTTPGTPVQRSECHHDACKTRRRAGHNAVKLRRARVSAQAMACLTKRRRYRLARLTAKL